jgi:hypothetical protein
VDGVASFKRNGNSPPTPLTSASALNATTDTMAAGFMINNFTFGSICTAGMVLDRSGTRYVGIASHCGTTVVGLDNDFYAQDFSGSATWIGNERWDTTVTGNRNSDEALVKDSTFMPAFKGLIARTTMGDSGASATRAVNTGTPFVYIFATGSPTAGLRVNKIGEATGWTFGTITNTCLDRQVQHSPMPTIHCEFKASVWSGQGDSGGSAWVWDGQDGATLIGAGLSGVDSTGVQTIDGITRVVGPNSYYSSYNGFISDIGSSGLSVVTGTSVGTFTPSGTVSSGNPVPAWTIPTITNPTNAPTQYNVYRATFSGGVLTEPEEIITSTTLTSYVDLGVTATSDNGTTVPPHNNWVSYRIVAYNGGATHSANTIYFIIP